MGGVAREMAALSANILDSEDYEETLVSALDVAKREAVGSIKVLAAVQRFLADARAAVRDAALAAFLSLTASPAAKAGALRSVLRNPAAPGDERRRSGRMAALGLLGHTIRNKDEELDADKAAFHQVLLLSLLLSSLE